MVYGTAIEKTVNFFGKLVLKKNFPGLTTIEALSIDVCLLSRAEHENSALIIAKFALVRRRRT